MNRKHLAIFALGIAAVSCGKSQKPEATVQTNDDVILHAWSWSFDTIANNMKTIADLGFDYVQTSPANLCYVGEDGGMASSAPKKTDRKASGITTISPLPGRWATTSSARAMPSRPWPTAPQNTA